MKIFNKEEVTEIANGFKNGELIAFPTETVFGLGVLVSNKQNYLKLVEAKLRKPDKPFTLMFSKFEQVEKYIDDNYLTKKIIEKCMPGALTIIVKAKPNIDEFIDYGTGFVGLRMPDDKFVLKMIDEIGGPLFVPSCNKAGEEPCKNVKEVIKVFDKEIYGVVEGNCEGGVPSTIIKIEDENITLIRQGNLTLEEIKEKIL